MWRYGLRDSGLPHVFSENLPGAHPRERVPARVQKEHALPFALLQCRTKLAKIDGGGAYRLASNWNQSLLRALPEYADKKILKHHIANGERDPLRDTKACAVGELEHGTVAECERLIERRRGQELLDLVDAQDFRKCAPALG